MDMLKPALCQELRNLLTVWNALQLNPDASPAHKERVRRKIYDICHKLDVIDWSERGAAK